VERIIRLSIAVICTICTIALTYQSTYGNQPNMVEVNTDNVGDLNLQSKSAILVEMSTGKVLYEHNSDEIVSPASITKIMTLILIFDAIEEGKISYDDVVTTSEYAKSMGGSQVFLETGEQQTVETLIKCIIIASGNDASVCMAEYVAGSEEAFVAKMNERASELGMTNTVFKDCCGLCDSMEHHTTARDVAIMSRELVTKYSEVLNYSKIWMENITHVTAQGTKEFTLSNTNKLLKQYEWATGLKTGSTSLAKYCLSATAEKNDVGLIAVIMGAPDYKLRFLEAITLLNYGYATVELYKDDNEEIEKYIKVENGNKEILEIKAEDEFTYVCGKDENIADITKNIEISKKVKAPIKKGEIVGKIVYYMGNEEIGKVNICAEENISQSGYVDYLKKMWYKYRI
jgi:D-alanyl-D-alanine carboxypeptidase (penicillin-binding protein 5/6)